MGQEETIRDLIQSGADVDATNEVGPKSETQLVSKFPKKEFFTKKLFNNYAFLQEGGTALMCACQWGMTGVVELLIQSGCNIHKAMQVKSTIHPKINIF